MPNISTKQPTQQPDDILIIDDTLSSLRALMSVLRQEGYTVRGASGGASALQMIVADPPDLILLDIRMPEMDGYEICRRLKADEKTAVIPVIFISAMGNIEDKIKGFAVGGIDYIPKPFQAEEVLARIQTQLTLRHLQHRLEIQNDQLQQEIDERHRVEVALKKANEQLEERVKGRSRDLSIANVSLVTESAKRKQAQAALRRSEFKYRTLFETLPVGVALVGKDGCTRAINSALSNLIGFSLEDMQTLDTNPTGLHPMQGAMKAFQSHIQKKGTVHGYATDLKTKDGRVLHVRLNATTLDLENESSILVVLDDITTQKQAETAQHESDEKLRTIVANTEAVLFMIDTEGVFILSEGKGLAILGLEPGQVVGMSSYELYKDSPSIVQGIRNALAGTTSHETINVGGIWFDIWYSPYCGTEGEVLGVIGMAVDITDRKKAEEALAERTERLRQLSRAVEQSPATIVITDLDGHIVYVNPQFCKTTGYSIDEAMGENPRILKSNYIPSSEYEILWETITNGREWHGEFYNRRKNGEYYWESASISPILDDSGVATHYLAVKEEITARKEMERALQQRADELAFINRVSHAMVSFLDIDHILNIMLEEIRALWDVTAGLVWLVESSAESEHGDFICRQITEPYQKEAAHWRLPVNSSILGWVLREKKGVVVADALTDPRYTSLIDQGTYPLRALLTVPLRSRTGIIGALQFVDEQVGRFTEDDLKLAEAIAATAVNAIENARLHQNLQTQLKQLKETQSRLVQSEKLAAIGELIAGIAHELNNPLASIILYAQLMEARGVDETVSRDLQQIVTQSHRANGVVQGLLDFARQRPSEHTSTQINSVLQSTLSLLAYELRTHNIVVETEFSTAVPVILADGHQLQQVFVNLINNALQAMDDGGKGGKLTVITQCSVSRHIKPANGKSILIVIQDDGPGIPQESASRIFDPFFTTKAVGKGTGLGLAVCHSIITNHNGTIWMESEPNRGAAFFIELPIVGVEEKVVTDVGKTAVSSPKKEGNGRRILIVDDEASILLIITRILHRKGYIVDTADNGRAALARLHAEKYDLVISDLRMPNMDGQEFYQKTIENYPEYNGRFIFTTGDSMHADLQDFLTDNNTITLEKPFEMTTLVDAVAKILSQK